MPELPEVQTSVNGLRDTVIGLTITDVWSSYNSPYFKGSETIKDPAYFKKFRKSVVGRKIISAERRAKNILINLSGGMTILMHLKMTGHPLYGKYIFEPKKAGVGGHAPKDPWRPIGSASLEDPFNRHIRLVFSLSDGKSLALSDMRKFAKVTALPTAAMHQSEHLNDLGPEPLEAAFTFERFLERINLRPKGKIKQVIMDQSILAGVGNIYADESLWLAGIHPAQQIKDLTGGTGRAKLLGLFKAIKKVLKSGVKLGGASTSDYRNIHGEMGESQGEHHAYRRTGDKCDRRGCGGTIVRIVLGTRGTHFCDRHQVLLKAKNK